MHSVCPIRAARRPVCRAAWVGSSYVMTATPIAFRLHTTSPASVAPAGLASWSRVTRGSPRHFTPGSIFAPGHGRDRFDLTVW